MKSNMFGAGDFIYWAHTRGAGTQSPPLGFLTEQRWQTEKQDHVLGKQVAFS